MTTLQKAFLLSFGIHLCLLGLWPNFRPPPVPDQKVLSLVNFKIEQAPSTVKAQTQESLNASPQKNAFTEKKQPIIESATSKKTQPIKKDRAQERPKQVKPAPPKREHQHAKAGFKKQDKKETKQIANTESQKNVNDEKRQSADKEHHDAMNQESKGSAGASDHHETGNATAAKAAPSGATNRQDIADAYRQKLAERLAKAKYYPTLAQRRGMEGKVMVRFVIDRHGNIQSVNVTESSGYAILDEAAVKAVQSVGRFAPFPPEIPDPQWEITFAMVYQLKD